MNKKLELYSWFLFETTFLDKWILLDINESFEKNSKQNLKMAESSRSLSPNKKKVKRSKLGGAATNKTTFKSEKIKEFPFMTRLLNDVRGNWLIDVIETVHYFNFLGSHQICSISGRYEVWKMLLRENTAFYIISHRN